MKFPFEDSFLDDSFGKECLRFLSLWANWAAHEEHHEEYYEEHWNIVKTEGDWIARLEVLTDLLERKKERNCSRLRFLK